MTVGGVCVRGCGAGATAISYYANYLKIGVLVLLIHDASDIGVDTLKLVNYTKLRGATGWFGSEVCDARAGCARCENAVRDPLSHARCRCVAGLRPRLRSR